MSEKAVMFVAVSALGFFGSLPLATLVGRFSPELGIGVILLAVAGANRVWRLVRERG